MDRTGVSGIHLKRILIITKGNRSLGSSRYRAFHPAERLAERGWRVTWGYQCDQGTLRSSREFRKVFRRTLRVILLREVDVVLFQRADRLRWEGTLALLCCRIRSIPAVYDVDDTVDWEENWSARMFVRRSALTLTASTALREAVTRFRPGRRVLLLHTPFDERLYRCEPEGGGRREAITFGFIGDGYAYRDGIMEVLESVSRLPEETRRRLRFVFLGNNQNEIERLTEIDLPRCESRIVRDIDWSDERSLVAEVRSWYFGIIPFRRSKFGGYFKAIQYMALGIPPIARAEGEASFLIEDGVSGYLIRSADEWSDRIVQLVDNPGLRAEMAHRGPAHVRRFALDRFCDRLEKAIVECETRGGTDA